MREWATPAASLMNYSESPESFEARSARLVEQGTRPLGVNLGQQAQTWSNATGACEGRRDLQTDVARWSTPRASDGDKGGPNQTQKGKPALSAQAANWPTPRASEGKGTGPEGSKSHTHRLERGYLDAAAVSFRPGRETLPAGSAGSRPVARLRLNPDFVEALMGWPPGWSLPVPRWGSGGSPSSPPGGSTDSDSSATASCPCRPPKPSDSSQDT